MRAQVSFTHKGDVEEMVVYSYGIDDLVPGIEPEEDKDQSHGYQAP